MSTSSARWATAALGAAFVADVLLGRSALLVRPWFAAPLVATGLLLLVVAWRDRASFPPVTALVLLLPVLAGLTLTPQVAAKASQGQLDTAALTRRIGDGANPLLDGKGGAVNLLQIRIAEQQVGSVLLSGREVTVEAKAADAHTLTRSAILCCAADARAVTVPESGPVLPKGAWVRVTGRLTSSSGRLVLAATDVVPIEVPAEPFL